jgi:hypothetical protein
MCWLKFCTLILIRPLLKCIFTNMFYFSFCVFEIFSYIKFSIYLDECFQNLFRIISKFNFQVQFSLLAYTGHIQKNGAVLKVDKQFTSHPTRTQHILSAAGIVRVSHALPAVGFSHLLQCRGTSFQDGVAAGKGFLCASY